MDVIKINNSCQTINMANINMRGLTSAQAALYQYLEKCNKEKAPVLLDTVAEIYFTKVKKPRAYFHEERYRIIYTNHGRHPDYINLINENAVAYFNKPENESHKTWYINYPTKQWMKGTIGSLVMRGLLSIIPVFDTEITTIDDHGEK